MTAKAHFSIGLFKEKIAENDHKVPRNGLNRLIDLKFGHIKTWYKALKKRKNSFITY